MSEMIDLRQKVDEWQAEADAFDAKGDAWDEFLNRKNPIEYSDSYAGFQFGWNAAIAYMKGERKTLKVPDICKCPIRQPNRSEWSRCGKPYHPDGSAFSGRNA